MLGYSLMVEVEQATEVQKPPLLSARPSHREEFSSDVHARSCLDHPECDPHAWCPAPGHALHILCSGALDKCRPLLASTSLVGPVPVLPHWQLCSCKSCSGGFSRVSAVLLMREEFSSKRSCLDHPECDVHVRIQGISSVAAQPSLLQIF